MRMRAHCEHPGFVVSHCSSASVSDESRGCMLFSNQRQGAYLDASFTTSIARHGWSSSIYHGDGAGQCYNLHGSLFSPYLGQERIVRSGIQRISRRVRAKLVVA
jgi:hypothetical protein